ncbi:MAG: hypothetical protein U9Q83_04820 [Bacteroidota bacterium]|nr:hypothetical protein [Bacteroidota bacterium]
MSRNKYNSDIINNQIYEPNLYHKIGLIFSFFNFSGRKVFQNKATSKDMAIMSNDRYNKKNKKVGENGQKSIPNGRRVESTK